MAAYNADRFITLGECEARLAMRADAVSRATVPVAGVQIGFAGQARDINHVMPVAFDMKVLDLINRNLGNGCSFTQQYWLRRG